MKRLVVFLYCLISLCSFAQQNKNEIDGYRVQIYSSNDPENARSEALNLENRLKGELGQVIYVQNLAPFWKVRIGDFISFEEAREYMRQFERLHPELRNSTFIVRDKIQYNYSSGNDNNTSNNPIIIDGKLYHVIQQGDNLNGIAEKYHVSVMDIAKMNNIKRDFLIGRKLLLPRGAYITDDDYKTIQEGQKDNSSISKQPSQSEVDKSIPRNKEINENTYVLIITNENYLFLNKVAYATNDGKIFQQYCLETLGVPEKQIFYYSDATSGLIADGVEKLKYCLDNFEGSKGIVYYCGHGIPEEKSKQAYIIPVDGKGTNMATCYSLNKLYKTLAGTKAQSVTYFLDACFTGANKEGGMLVAARGVAVKPVGEPLSGKTIVFSASSNDETAMTLNEQGHGLFTYYLLKKLQETKGNVTYGELADYINQNVKKDAFLINEKPQTPVVATSPAVVNTWKSMKLK